ncbi:stage III sporulation protein SpoIIIAB [Brevibacillus dissolubilis]|uniref:stage III sporulation protein SpoIIIAB n=1 Tax=Brevibacillus dissolubilis TaxID=1844116 RepID=UPI0011167965|nr:stage III sporulation protein SpoIIIAB [Brevibacillus dissolubilis]
MLKLIGAVIVLLSATMAGFYMGRQLNQRTLQIRGLLLALQLLETEILYGATPLKQAFDKLGRRLPPELGRIFNTASENLASPNGQSTQSSIQAAIDRHWSGTAMKPSEKEVLMSLGYVLGNSDREDQKKHLQLAMSHLRSLETEARDEQGRYERMYRSLGFLSGLLVVILMF